MGWESIKGSGPWVPGESGVWTTPGAFPEIRPSINKIYYSEGDRITSAYNPIFTYINTDPTIPGAHDPCGYWHRNWVPAVTTYYTSKPYPIQCIEDLYADNMELLEGRFSENITYSLDDNDIASMDVVLLSGSFRASVLGFITPVELLESKDITLTSGMLKSGLVSFTTPIEELEAIDVTLTYGYLGKRLITYSYWIPENIESTNITLIGGTHGTT